MSELWSRRCRPWLVAAVLPASLLAGCGNQPVSGEPIISRSELDGARVAEHGAHVQEVLRYNRTRQAVRRSCLLSGSRSDPADVPGLEIAGGREALAELCAASSAPPPHARGAIVRGYERWLNDQPRELSVPSETASRAGE